MPAITTTGPPITRIGLARREDQRHAVDERDHHLEAVEAVGALPVGRPPGEPEREPGERQRGEVGEHVPGVGEQGQRARQQAAEQLGQHEAADQDRGPENPPLVVAVRVHRAPVCRSAESQVIGPSLPGGGAARKCRAGASRPL
jgi:hypothetical protein